MQITYIINKDDRVHGTNMASSICEVSERRSVDFDTYLKLTDHFFQITQDCQHHIL